MDKNIMRTWKKWKGKLVHKEMRDRMITLTKLNDEQFVLNAELIKTVESTPDTIITITTGNKYVVKEKAEDVVSAVVQYKREIFKNFME